MVREKLEDKKDEESVNCVSGSVFGSVVRCWCVEARLESSLIMLR